MQLTDGNVRVVGGLERMFEAVDTADLIDAMDARPDGISYRAGPSPGVRDYEAARSLTA